jgi:LmbE family N-acetylglucosaminyl deacetylase
MLKLSFTEERVLAVLAHPDDAEILCAGTLARAKRDGAEIAICVMCQGDKGLPSGHVPENFVEVRKSEASEAAATLGAKLFWFGSPDGELMDGVPQRRKLIEIYRQFKATLVISHAMEDYHADHRAAGAIAEAATWFSASRGHVTDSPPLESPPALWIADTLNMSGFVPEFYIDVTEHMALKKRMLHCHRSQLQRWNDKDFAPLTDLMLRQSQTRGAQAGVEAAEAFRAHHAFKRIRAF